MKVGVQTGTFGPEYWELLTYRNLKMFNKSHQDIVRVEYSQYYPGYPYAEKGVAYSSHPLIGSGSAILFFNDGTKGTICDLFFQDPNLKRNHFEGSPHWNHERRFGMDGWDKPIIQDTSKTVENHSIPASAYIDILGMGTNVTVRQNSLRVKWEDQVEIDTALIQLDRETK